VNVTPYDIAQRFLGLKETFGKKHTPMIVAMAQLDTSWVEDDETAWCSAFVNFVCFLLGVPRSRSLAARSWLLVGTSIPLSDAARGADVVVLKRGKEPQPGPEVIKAQGHVGFYAGQTATTVELLAGNQGNAVSIASFPKSQILSIRRLA
jgi:uncharacterized protein (TIGR02594 family)